MIVLYTGTPGSGKSLHMARDIMEKLRWGRGVISTVDVNLDVVTNKGRKKIGQFVYKPIFELSPAYLYEYAYKHHKRGQEGQTWVFLDECQLIFNSREYGRKDRMEWNVFFTHHRHLGFHFVLVTQWDRLIDRQVRCLCEEEVNHRKLNNFGFLWALPIKIFVAVSQVYGIRMREGAKWFVFRRKHARLYDSFALWDFGADKLPAAAPATTDGSPATGTDARTETGAGGPPSQAARPGPLGAFRTLFKGRSKGLEQAAIKE